MPVVPFAAGAPCVLKSVLSRFARSFAPLLSIALGSGGKDVAFNLKGTSVRYSCIWNIAVNCTLMNMLWSVLLAIC